MCDQKRFTVLFIGHSPKYNKNVKTEREEKVI